MKKKDIQKQRNIYLSQEVEDLKAKLEFIDKADANNRRIVLELINELDYVIKEHKKALKILDKQKERYSKLIDDTIKIKNQLKRDKRKMRKGKLFDIK